MPWSGSSFRLHMMIGFVRLRAERLARILRGSVEFEPVIRAARACAGDLFVEMRADLVPRRLYALDLGGDAVRARHGDDHVVLRIGRAAVIAAVGAVMAGLGDARGAGPARRRRLREAPADDRLAQLGARGIAARPAAGRGGGADA